MNSDTLRVQPEVSGPPHQLDMILAQRVCMLFGAHPTSMLGKYSDDEEHWNEYIRASNNNESFKKYINKYIHSSKNNDDYLNKIGGAHLSSLLQVDTQK